MPRFNPDTMLEELERDEGLKLNPYRDTVGKLTIGIGRNLDDLGITPDEAYVLALNDVERVTSELDLGLGMWWREMTDARQRALINMGFNLGITRLMNFRKMLGVLKAANYGTAANEALDSKWAEQVGERAERIAVMFREGAP